ncbi:MAG: hypothetical protein M1824_002607 [Vezdaea acicularis]|nr:MAG: hypothetical protein M1824_002607 [Vezdaea acicularis]
MTTSEISSDPKTAFHQRFQRSSAEIQAQIDALSKGDTINVPDSSSQSTPMRLALGDALNTILYLISGLSDDLRDAVAYLPTYDQRAYSGTLKTLTDNAHAALTNVAPKKKFGFKNSRAPPPAPTDAPATPKPQVVSNVLHAASAPSVPSNSLTLTNLNSTLYTPPSLPSDPPQTLTLNSVSYSVLFLGKIDGPAHLTSLSECVILLSCHQLRVHDCKNVDVYLWCRSRPIIEACHGMRFAPLSGSLGLDGKGENQWEHVDDFRWLKQEQSPNWSILPSDMRVKAEDWEEVADADEAQREILKEKLLALSAKRRPPLS